MADDCTERYEFLLSDLRELADGYEKQYGREGEAVAWNIRRTIERVTTSDLEWLRYCTARRNDRSGLLPPS